MTALAPATLNEPRYDAALDNLAKCQTDVLCSENMYYLRARQKSREVAIERLVDELKLTEASLIYSQVYFLSDVIRNLLDIAAVSVPAETEFTRELFPTEHGFVHFQTPVVVETYDKRHPEDGILKGTLNAMSWSMYRHVDQETYEALEKRNDVYNLGGYNSSLMAVSRSSANLTDHPTHVLLAMWLSPFKTGEEVRTGTRYVPVTLPVHWGETFDDAADSDEAEMRVTSRSGRYCLGLLMSFLKFCMQKILEPEERAVSRGVVRRLEHATKQNQDHRRKIKVIRLRQRTKSSTPETDEEEHRRIEWTCQWMVGGHWRHYTGKGGHRPQTIWISAYPKGPIDKPFNESATKIFAVVR